MFVTETSRPTGPGVSPATGPSAYPLPFKWRLVSGATLSRLCCSHSIRHRSLLCVMEAAVFPSMVSVKGPGYRRIGIAIPPPSRANLRSTRPGGMDHDPGRSPAQPRGHDPFPSEVSGRRFLLLTQARGGHLGRHVQTGDVEQDFDRHHAHVLSTVRWNQRREWTKMASDVHSRLLYVRLTLH